MFSLVSMSCPFQLYNTSKQKNIFSIYSTKTGLQINKHTEIINLQHFFCQLNKVDEVAKRSTILLLSHFFFFITYVLDPLHKYYSYIRQHGYSPPA